MTSSETTTPKKIRTANLRRKRRTIITGFAPGDRVLIAFDRSRWEWRVAVESANGIRFVHDSLDSSSALPVGEKR